MNRRRLLIAAGALVVLGIVGAGALYVSVKTGIFGQINTARAWMLARSQFDTNIIFMHQSVGADIIRNGNVREQLAALGYGFWDHGYNHDGLIGPEGFRLRADWNVPNDNTLPDGYYAIFNQPVTDPPGNVLSHMLQYDVIAFKSCYPCSSIKNAAQLEEYKGYYQSILEVMDRYPDKVFIVFTPPPMVPEATTPEEAAFAQEWTAWLNESFAEGHANVFVFDLFSLLADEDGYLREAYRAYYSPTDSHPNTLAGQEIGPAMVAFFDNAIQSHSTSAAATGNGSGS